MLATKTAEVSGLKKAAILLVSVTQETAGRILSSLDSETVEQVTREIARLGEVTAEVRRKVIEEYYQLSVAQQYVQQGGMDYARVLLKKSLPTGQAEEILRNVEQAMTSRPFSFLERTDPANLVTFLQEEHPQTIALVLAHLESEQAAQVLKGLESRKQMEVVKRLASMENTNPEVIQEVEQGLGKRMASVVSQKLEKAGGVETVALMLNHVDRSTEKGILEALEAESPQLTEDIRKLMFVFEDIMLVDDKGVQQLLKEVEMEDLALAMKTASEELKEKMFRNMSERAATLLSEDMEYMGPVRLAEVEAAQQKIADIVRRLEEAGELVIQGRGPEEQVVV